jgi:hypothetical protein
MKTTPAGDIEERRAAAEAALEEALRERNRLWERLNRQQADRRELEYLRAELRRIRALLPWRLVERLRRR